MPTDERQLMHRVEHIHFIGVGGAGMSGIAEVLRNIGYRADGTLTQPGDRVGPFASREGFHLVEVLTVERVAADDRAWRREVAQRLLEGTPWPEP